MSDHTLLNSLHTAIKYCVIYVRVSHSSQVDGFSLDSQIEQCSKKAQELGYTVIKIFREEGISAKDTNRPQLQEMLTFCRNLKNKIHAVFVYSISRLNRNTLDFLGTKYLLSKLGISILSCTEPNSNTPEGDFISMILSGAAELDNKTKARVVSANMHKRFLAGYVTVRPPMGYTMTMVNGKSGQVPDPETFEIVKKTWHKIDDEKLTLREVSQMWDKLGIKSKSKRFTHWHTQSLSKIFSDKFYIGILTSKSYPEEPRGIHEPMIDEGTFYRVRELLTERKLPNSVRRTTFREDFPLRQILRCVECKNLGIDRKLTSGWSTGKNAKFAYYFCTTRGLHKFVSIPKRIVEEVFITLLQSIKPTEHQMQFFTEIMQEKHNNRFASLVGAAKVVEKEVAELKSTIKTLKYKNLKGVYSDDEYREIKDELESQIVVKQGIVSEKKIDQLDIRTTLEFMKYYLTHLDEIWLKATVEGKFKIGCSIFPKGLYFSKNSYQTPLLGTGYRLTQNNSRLKWALDHLSQTQTESTILAYQNIYKELIPYINLNSVNPREGYTHN